MGNKKKLNVRPAKSSLALIAFFVANLTSALVITEDFTKKSASNNWFLPKAGGGTKNNVACLTAGEVASGTGSPTVAGTLPKCSGYADPNGSGALRLTGVATYVAGGIVSGFTFPTNEGVDVSFVTYTYGGTNADGMTFFLTDGKESPSLGAQGGSLGYSCANSTNKGEGIIGGYLGLGIDEQGNFLNRGDNTNTGPGRLPGAIGLRGAGSINWKTLSRDYPQYYPSTLNSNLAQQASAVGFTCTTGTLWKFNGTGWVNTGEPVDNYRYLSHVALPADKPIGNQNIAKDRKTARPITYKLKITSTGLLSLWWSYNGGDFQAVLVDKDIVTTNGALPESFRFGFSGATGAATNVHEILCFKAAPAALSDNNLGASFPDNEYRTESQIFVSLYDSYQWWASLKAQNIMFNKATGELKADPVANWDASCRLTGGDCLSTQAKGDTALSPDSRQILTFDSGSGTAFRWNDLSESKKDILSTEYNAGGISINNQGELRLEYLRGDRTNEEGRGKSLFRKRVAILGDIIDAGPTWVGAPTKYKDKTIWQDKLNGGTAAESDDEAQTYAQFKEKYNDRLHVVYVGSNDGYMHAFRAGAYDSTGDKFNPTVTKPNDGEEILAYMPQDVLGRIHNTTTGQDLSHPQYGHNYFHNATPGVGDLFYKNKWHTWLVSGLGDGGATVYALDITDPTGENDSKVKFVEGNAKNIVIGEWSHNATDPIWQNLGNSYGTPEIGRFHDGNWGAVFGNGWCDKKAIDNKNCKATTGKAGIYVMTVDKEDGSTRFQFLDTGVGSPEDPNGIAHVTPVDLDGDDIIDYVYAGDLKGNVWRFDLTSGTASQWSNNSAIYKLFTAGNGQPVTTKLMVSHKEGSRVMVGFGTGKKTVGHLYNPISYEVKEQSIYGVWDGNLSSWNSRSAVKYIVHNNSSTTKKSNLLKQTFNKTTNKMSKNNICWADNISCTSSKHYGWYIDLEARGVDDYEQVIYNPGKIDEYDLLMVNTYIPGKDTAIACGMSDYSGYSYPINLYSGQGLDIWDDNFDGEPYRRQFDSTGGVSFVKIGDQYYLPSKANDGGIGFPKLRSPFDKTEVHRITWVILS